MVVATYTISLATADGANPASWTDITSRVKSVQITRGRDDVLAQVQTGTAQISVTNDDGRFSPGNTGSTLYPHVATMRAIKVVATYSATAYPLFFGYIQTITPNLNPSQRDCTIALADGFAWLDIATTTPTYTSAASGTSIGTALDSASWPAALRSLATGQSTFTPSYTDQSVLAQVQGIGIDNEGGLVYMDGQGRFVFQDRHTRLKSPYLTSNGTFTDADGINDLAATRSVSDIANEVKVTHSTGSVTASDATSITAKGSRRLNINATFIGASEASDRASWTLSIRKDELDRPSLRVVANASATLMAQCLGRELSDRVTITDSSTGGSSINADYSIERIEHAIDNGGTLHVTTWQLSPISGSVSSFWAIDSGALDTTTRLAY